MDNYSLSISFSINLKDNISSNINNIEFLDIIITDENKNILYCKDQDMFNTYCRKNNLNYIWKDTSILYKRYYL